MGILQNIPLDFNWEKATSEVKKTISGMTKRNLPVPGFVFIMAIKKALRGVPGDGSETKIILDVADETNKTYGYPNPEIIMDELRRMHSEITSTLSNNP